MSKTKIKVSSHLFVTGLLSSCITLVISLIYITLSLVALVNRNNCDLGSLDTTSGSGFLLNTLFRVYILKDECSSSLKWEGVTEKDTVFVLVLVTLIASILTMIAAIAFVTVLNYEDGARYVHLVAYVYIGVCVASLVVDITVSSHFGTDYDFLNKELNLSSPGLNMNYTRDMVRLAALVLMTIALKGFMAHAIGLVLHILLVIYIADYQKKLPKEEHSIHNQGALNAYEVPKRQEDAWQSQPEMFLGSRGTQINPAYLNDEERMPRNMMRDQPVNDYSSRTYERSESWQPGPITGARPFSYLEEVKRPIPVKPPTTHAVDPEWSRSWNRSNEPQWNRNQWPPTPPVPAPDYSPPNTRRLKSALKPGYM